MVEYTETLKSSIAITAAFAETVVNVPTPRLGGYSRGSRYRMVTCMVVHNIRAKYKPTTPGTTLDAAGDYVRFQVTKQSKTAYVENTDNDKIFDMEVGVLSAVTHTYGKLQKAKKCYPPILIPGQKIFISGITNDAGNVGTMYIEFDYTMREVAESDVVRAQIV